MVKLELTQLLEDYRLSQEFNMKIADYGKAITSYIESPTTAQKLKSKKLAGLMEEYLGDQLDYQKAVDEGFQGTEEAKIHRMALL